jgi:hypothetical protein
MYGRRVNIEGENGTAAVAKACAHNSVVSASDAARSALRSEAVMQGAVGHIHLGRTADSYTAAIGVIRPLSLRWQVCR